MTNPKPINPPAPPPGVVAAFVAALAELRPPAFDRNNPAFRNYRYASLAAHVDASRPTLARFGLAIVQPVEPDERGNLVVRTRLYHGPTGEALELGSLPFAPNPTDPQKTISALTYYRRASLASALGFVGEEDDDAESVSAPIREEAERKRAPAVAVADAIARTGSASNRLAPALPPRREAPPPDAVSVASVVAGMTVDEIAKPNPAAWSDGDDWRRVTVKRYATKSGVTKGREWVRHAILIDDAGADVWCSTFDRTTGDVAKSLVNAAADIVTKPVPGGCEIVKLRAAVDRDAIPQTQPTTEVSDDDIPF